jgi:DNA-binding beta-propeller fold protein YncE
MKRHTISAVVIATITAAAGCSKGVTGPGVSDLPFEVWVADQSDTRPGYGGQLLIFEGADLLGNSPAQAQPIARLDLGEATAALCHQATGRNPVRPHMLLFNEEQSHAVLSFVASGHVVIFDAATRAPISCFESTIGSTGTRQAHAAIPAPDGSFVVVANQNGKRLERIDTDFRTNSYTYNLAATLDLATCTTPSGRPCEDPELRPINWPICPVVASDSRHVFVTLRGGGLFVVDATQTPMKIVAEYDQQTVNGNGCGGVEVAGHMYINSGGSPVGVAANHHHKFGFDVYRFPLRGYSATNEANSPAPVLVLSKTGESDSHGMVATGDSRYLWVMDRYQNVVEIIDIAAGQRVNTFDLAGTLSSDPAPDITDIAPSGERVFAALRGPVPLSGDPHNSTGTTPGLGILEVREGGRTGEMIAVVRIENPNRQGTQQPDPHTVQVRVRR